MSWVEKAIARENEILRIIEIFTKADLEFVLVGGYAVSASARHRFSVDCDLVIPKTSVQKFEQVLQKEGYKKKIQKSGFDEVYGGQFISYSKKVGEFPVTADLLVESLVCRTTAASWSYPYIKKNSVRKTVFGIEKSVDAVMSEKELLVAFKIHSGRESDLRDVVVLSGDLDLENVRRHLQKGDAGKLKEQIANMLKMLGNTEFESSVKGVYGMREDVSPHLARTRRILERLLSSGL